jgi:isopenicillin N synthase-like dioxygenase
MPRSLRSETDTIIDFQNKCLRLCRAIFELFAVSLGIQRDWFTDRHSNPAFPDRPASSIFRLLYYPRVTADYEDGVDIRAGAHSDYGSITLLFQQRGQPGLEIKTPAGEWAAVPVSPAHTANEGEPLPILVNIGDLLEDWTGGLLKSTVHRVIFPQGGGDDRYSIAYFCHPLDDALLEAVPSERVREYVERTGRSGTKDGKVLTAKDHLMERLAATYTVK